MVGWVGSRVVHRQWRWPDLAISVPKCERGKGFQGKGKEKGEEREKGRKEREKEKNLFMFLGFLNPNIYFS